MRRGELNINLSTYLEIPILILLIDPSLVTSGTVKYFIIGVDFVNYLK